MILERWLGRISGAAVNIYFTGGGCVLLTYNILLDNILLAEVECC
jgi:hypothetical protein